MNLIGKVDTMEYKIDNNDMICVLKNKAEVEKVRGIAVSEKM